MTFPIIPSEEGNPRLLLDNTARRRFCQLRSAGLSRRRLSVLRVRLRRIYPTLRFGAFPLRSFAMFQRRFNPLNGRFGLPSAGLEGMTTNPSRQGRVSVVAAGRQGYASFGYGYIGGSLARSNVSYCISGLPKLISSAYGICVARR